MDATRWRRGSIQFAGREVADRATRPQSERLRDAVTWACAGKYDTKASEKWVLGIPQYELEAPASATSRPPKVFFTAHRTAFPRGRVGRRSAA
jgi:hypothetical protein